jgi:hypothetical protein
MPLVLPRTAWTQDQPKNRLAATVVSGSGAPASPSSAAVASASRGAEREAVIAYLGQGIGWYRHLEVEQRLATEPAEILYLADDRQMAAEVAQQAFEYARAKAALLNADKDISAAGSGVAKATADGSHSEPPAVNSSVPDLAGLIARGDRAEAELKDARARLQDLQARLAQSSQPKRDDLSRRIVAVQGEIDLAQSRADSINAMVEFESGTAGAGPASTGLDEQIDELERSLPQAGGAAAIRLQAAASAVADAKPSATATVASGILGRIEGLIELREKELTLFDTIDLTSHLLATVAKTRAPLIQALHDVNSEASTLTKRAYASDLAAIEQNKAEFESLSQRHKLVAAAVLPLSKQVVLLNLYSENLTRWRDTVQQRFSEMLRGLILRLFGLALLIAVVFAAAFVWRKLIG